MKLPLSIAFFALLGLALLALGSAASGQAAPKRHIAHTRQLADPTDSARVIVKFREESELSRRHALTASSGDAREVAQKLDARATTLGARLGLALKAGRALGERTQVLTAQGLSGTELAGRLSREEDVEYAVVDRRRFALLVPNDPLYLSGGSNGPTVGQWYLRAPDSTVVSSINAQAAWDITTGDSSIVVAVLDTGVRTEHPDLAGKLLPGYDMVTNVQIANDGNARDSDPSDPGDWLTASDVMHDPFIGCDVDDGKSSWHGTKTSSLIGAASNNGVGMAGVAWDAKLLPVRVLGKCGGYDSDITVGMKWAVGIPVPGLPDNANPAKVLNMSLGGSGACTPAEAAAYIDAISAVTAKGAIIVAAAGNSNGHAVGLPASCAGVVAVGGVRHIGTKVGFSDVGTEVTLSAPAGNCVNTGAADPCLYPILAATNTGTQGPVASTYTDSNNYSVGTSFSAPLVSGTIALMLSRRSSLTHDQVVAALKSTARAFPASGAPADPQTGPIQTCHAPDSTDQLQCYCTTTTCGAGMLDTAAAVSAATNAVIPVIDTTPAAPTAGSAVTLSVAGSLLPSGHSIASVHWTLVSGGGIVSGFSGGSSTASGTTTVVQPSAAGSFTVQVTLTDDHGTSASTSRSITVAAAASSGGGGGGALQPLTLIALAAFAAVLLGVQNRERQQQQ